MTEASRRLADILHSIPRGRCASYGMVGQAMNPPLSGLFVGRMLASAHPEAPWWRVVGHDGSIKTGKRDPELAAEQVRRLESEGIRLDGDRVPISALLEFL